MKTLFILVIICIEALVSSCSKHENSSPTQETSPIYNHTWAEPGKVTAVFVDSITQEQASSFLDSIDLRTYILTGFGTNTFHRALIDVPIGEEQKWVDVLIKYPEIKSAGRVMVVEES